MKQQELSVGIEHFRSLDFSSKLSVTFYKAKTLKLCEIRMIYFLILYMQKF